MKKKYLITLFTLTAFIIISCDRSSGSADRTTARRQKVVLRNNEGRVIKTFDGYIYRVFDSAGRQIEWYGNYKNDESHSNIHNFLEYGDNLIVLREYLLEDLNVKCAIADSLNCFISKYYYEGANLSRTEYYRP